MSSGKSHIEWLEEQCTPKKPKNYRDFFKQLTYIKIKWITSILEAYMCAWCLENRNPDDYKMYYFNGKEYHIMANDFTTACEIIDFIADS